jgi:predicted RNase H-like HicB family nuclease
MEVPMKYRIALHKSEEGYSVSVPGLPGCWSQGATEEEAVENIRDAIREYLSVVMNSFVERMCAKSKSWCSVA